ncbi:DUF5011 domain-containing protein, partial [bacterium]|nr:DUF5011 domain-containing protein [bacterium]
MRAKWIITSLVASCIAAVAARGQGPVITSFKPNGELTWTNAVIGGEYDVEWTCSLGGPWNDSWESITGIVASDTTMTVNVPMFRGSLLRNAGAGSPTAPWTSGGPDSVYINDLAVDPTSPDTVFAAIDGEHLAKTTNGGASWDYVDNSPTDLGAVTIDPQEPPTMYAGAAYREWPANIVFAIRKGTEGGQSWARLGNMFTAWGYHDFGVSDIYVHPRDSNTILVALAGFGGENHPGGVHKTTDGGQTWERTYGFWANTLAAHPHDPDIVYFGTARWGYVFQSTDAGSTWQDFSPGGEWVWEVRDIEVDSNSHVYAATSEGLRKCDGLDGSNWAKLTGLPTDDITALAIDRSTSPGIVYAGTAGGVFVSEDGGNTWLPFMDGLGNVTISDLALTEGQSKILYAGTAGGVWSRPACAQATHTIFYRVARVPDPNPPVITLLGDNPVALELGTPYTEPGFSATDDIDGDITEWVVVTGSVDRTVPGTYTLRYSVADSGGNPAVERTRAVNVVDNSASPPGMRHIPAGSFQMGDNYDEGETDDVPLHAVDVDAFYMDKYHVTKAVWDDVYIWNETVDVGYSFDNPGWGKGADHPVHTINWYDAVKWCNARSEKEGLTPVYYTSSGMTTVYRSGQL